MHLTPGIRQIGFRKWYERELLRGHAHLVLAFLCMISLMAAFEGVGRFHEKGSLIQNGLTALVAGGLGIWALRRYLYHLMHAENVAAQADCPGCGTYARFALVRDGGAHQAGVRCVSCAHEWTIVDADNAPG